MKRHWHTFLLLSLLAAAFSVAPALAGVPMPDVPQAIKGEQCVEDTDVMRREHMNLLNHQRDDTLRLGIRTRKHSLKNCFTCHVVKGNDGKAVTAADPRHFCRECHDYAAVKIDCFQCHTSTPTASSALKGGKL